MRSRLAMRSLVLSGALHALVLAVALGIGLRWSSAPAGPAPLLSLEAVPPAEVFPVEPEPEPPSEPAPDPATGPEPRLVEPPPRTPRPLPAPTFAALPVPADWVLLDAPVVGRRIDEPPPSSAPPPARPLGPPAAAPVLPELTGPVLLEGPPPRYPAASIRLGEEGSVRCRLHVDARGHVTRVEVVASSGHARLDRAARDALRAWRFHPAREDGRPVEGTYLHVVTFRLEA